MQILVTGGAGFIGQHLVRRLTRDHSNSVIVLDNLRRVCGDTLAANGNKILFRQGDVRDTSTVAEAMRGCEVVFHLAAQSNVLGAVRDIEYSFSTNVQGTFNVLKAAREGGVRRVVFTSSREVYGDSDTAPRSETAPMEPKNAYGVSKAAGEMYCRILSEGSLEIVVLRIANAYGPGDRDRVIPIFVENAILGTPLVLYGGTQVLDFVWIETVVDALMKAAWEHSVSGPINIGSGKGITVTDLARRIVQLTGSQSILHVEPQRQAEVSCFVANITRAKEQFGIQEPEDPLFGLRNVIDSMRATISR
jgi:UDP-glucose 4-epimerase